MKYLFAIMATLLMSTSLWAQSGFFYDPTRSGEGINVTIDGDTAAFALYTYWDSKVAVPPVVSPTPPHPLTPCHSCPIWYVATGDWEKETSAGKVYMSLPIDYPNTLDAELNVEFVIGTYFLMTAGNGYKLTIFCNSVVPSELYMCNNDFNFYQVLIGD